VTARAMIERISAFRIAIPLIHGPMFAVWFSENLSLVFGVVKVTTRKRKECDRNGKKNDRAEGQRTVNADQCADKADCYSTESAESHCGHRKKPYQSAAQVGRRQNLYDRLGRGIERK